MSLFPLSALDKAFVALESPQAPMHVGWAALFSPPSGAPRPSFEALSAHRGPPRAGTALSPETAYGPAQARRAGLGQIQPRPSKRPPSASAKASAVAAATRVQADAVVRRPRGAFREAERLVRRASERLPIAVVRLRSSSATATAAGPPRSTSSTGRCARSHAARTPSCPRGETRRSTSSLESPYICPNRLIAGKT